MGNNNKQSQSVKVVVNNKMCCAGSRRKRRPRRKETPKEGGETPMDEVEMPLAPPIKDFARGLSAYPIRPSLYAPISQLIQPQSGLNQVPFYFEKQFTNQKATLDELKKQLEDIKNNTSLTLFNNPLYQTTTSKQPQGLAPARREGVKRDDIPLQQATTSQQTTQKTTDPDELRRDFRQLSNYLGEYETLDKKSARSNTLKGFMNTILKKYNLQYNDRTPYNKRVSVVEELVNNLP